MRKNILFIATIILGICLSACSSTSTMQATSPVQATSPTQTASPTQTIVTYVGNSGFLVTIGENKILIDGIFTGFAPEYIQPMEVQELIANAQPPFDNIDLILVTHAHDDHFNLKRVADYLLKNPGTTFVSTPGAADSFLQRPQLKDRVTSISLKSGESRELSVNGIRVVAYDISHGFGANGETYPNLGFLVDVDGVKFFHTGDMDPSIVTATYLKMLGLPGEKIDIAFLQHFSFRSTDSFSLATEGIAARFYIPIHYQFTTPTMNKELILRIVPDAILFHNELDSWVMPEAKPK
jgi:L-ascorbate metabolism protein UlaG (beta-lactamase superfamily)